jgi:hypothetical protein
MWKLLKIATFVVATACWFSWYFMWEYYDKHKAWVYDPHAGRIHELYTHGSVVYITSGEQHLLYGLMAGGIGSFVVTVVIHSFTYKTDL